MFYKVNKSSVTPTQVHRAYFVDLPPNTDHLNPLRILGKLLNIAHNLFFFTVTILYEFLDHK